MKVDIKRKRQGKTDYRSRMGLLKSGLARIVVRKTNKYILIQLVKSKEARDHIVLSVLSKDLIEKGWPKESSGSLKSVPAAYLTGLIAGKQIVEKIKKEKVIFDIGLQRNISGSRLYASLKGLIDAGVNLPHNEKAFPNEDRLVGKHLKKEIQSIINKVKANIK